VSTVSLRNAHGSSHTVLIYQLDCCDLHIVVTQLGKCIGQTYHPTFAPPTNWHNVGQVLLCYDNPLFFAIMRTPCARSMIQGRVYEYSPYQPRMPCNRTSRKWPSGGVWSLHGSGRCLS
jgi:hypothetical protein